jgi:hypothetical protein
MSGVRQVVLGFFMALLFSAIVLGSLSLSLLEAGYRLGQAPAPESSEVDLTGIQILSLAGDEVESNAPASQKEIAVILQPPPAPVQCVHPEGWIKITVLPDNTLKSLAHLYNSNVELLKKGNCMLTEGLMVNSELYVPPYPLQPTKAPPRPTYQPPVYYWTPYPTVQSWPTTIPWVPTLTPVTPPPTLPPTLPPTPIPTAQPPTPLPTAQPTPPNPVPTNPPPTEVPPTNPPPTEPVPTSPPPTEPIPTNPPPTEPVLTSPPPTEPPQPTPVPPTSEPQPTSEPLPQPSVPPPPPPTAPLPPPPPLPTAPPPSEPTSPSDLQLPPPTPG